MRQIHELQHMLKNSKKDLRNRCIHTLVGQEEQDKADIESWLNDKEFAVGGGGACL